MRRVWRCVGGWRVGGAVAVVCSYLQAAWAANGKEKGKPGSAALPPAAVAFFARTLHVPVEQARNRLDELLKLADKKGLDPKDPAFVKIADGLGVTTRQLLDALVALKTYLAEHEPGGAGARAHRPRRRRP